MLAVESVREWAIKYAEMGLSVLPLHGKKPFFERWYDVASNELITVDKWWKQDRNANVGILTGHKNRLFVVDIDPRNGGEASLDELLTKYGPMPKTWEAVTGSGGKHFYFRYPAFRLNTIPNMWPGIDIKSDGGQVVAAPSVHPETHQPYFWDGMAEIWEEPIGEAPLWLLDALHAHSAPKKQGFECPSKIPKGVQHMTLVSFAGALRKMGLAPSEILPSLWELNERRCEVPGPRENIEQIALSMAKYAPSDRNLYAEATKLWRMTRHMETKVAADREMMAPVDALTLLRKPTGGPQMIISDVLHNGLTILAGRPKAGKSWLTLQIALSVGTGGILASGLPVMKPGRVGYFALEESEDRTASRLQTLVESPDVALQNIEFMYRVKPLMAGGAQQIDDYLAASSPNVLIIDTFLALVQGGNKKSNVMRDEYQEVDILQKLAAKHKVAIVLVHHTNKDITASGIDAVAGSTGITAAADCIWIMKRQPEKRCALEVVGREVEQATFVMKLDLSGPIGWHIIESGDDAESSLERLEILELLRDVGARSPTQIAAELKKSSASVRMLLKKMYSAGSVLRQQNGTYVAVNK